MTLKMKIQHIPIQALATWIEQMFEILNETSISGEDKDWVETHYLTLHALAEDATKAHAAWVKCKCGRDLFTPIAQAYVSVRQGNMTIQCSCGTVNSIKFKITEQPVTLPF